MNFHFHPWASQHPGIFGWSKEEKGEKENKGLQFWIQRSGIFKDGIEIIFPIAVSVAHTEKKLTLSAEAHLPNSGFSPLPLQNPFFASHGN